jgi:hypothetical protein
MSTKNDSETKTEKVQNIEKEEKKENKEEEDIGVCLSDKTKKFKVPPTYDCVETLIKPKKWLEIPVLLQMILLSSYGFLYFLKLNPYVWKKKKN